MGKFKHGHEVNHTRSRILRIYRGMKSRCEYPKATSWQYYGAKGIKCLWTSFESFLEDMGPTYQDGLTIGRRDSSGHYCKENCQWETPAQQNRNYARNVWLEFRGERKVVSDWADEMGLLRSTVEQRLKLGWSTEKALTTPTDARVDFVEYQGLRLPVREWATRVNLKYATLRKRIKDGWPMDKAMTVPVRRVSI